MDNHNGNSPISIKNAKWKDFKKKVRDNFEESFRRDDDKSYHVGKFKSNFTPESRMSLYRIFKKIEANKDIEIKKLLSLDEKVLFEKYNFLKNKEEAA